MKNRILGALIVGLLFICPPIDAQTAARDPLATLGIWADGVWISLLDRDGERAGRLPDAGAFERFDAIEDTEYRLDIHTTLFSSSEDARWALRTTGLRAGAGSLTRPTLAQRVDWRERFVVSEGWTLEGTLLRERTFSASRDHLRTGLFWQPRTGESWEVGATLGLHYFKPSADVELVARRSWAAENVERGRVDVRVGLLDVANDFVFQFLGVSPDDAAAQFDYLIHPVAVRADGLWTFGPARFEVRTGVSRRSTVLVTFPAAGDPPYELKERVAFAGGLVELQPASRTTMALLGSVARVESERLGVPASPTDFSLRETTHIAGFRARQGLSTSLSLEADLFWTHQPDNRTTGRRPGSGPPQSVDRLDEHVLAGIALVRRPANGWTGRLFYVAIDRDAPQVTNHQTHLLTDGGYRFASGFEVTAGVRWDLDGGREPKFDGGQLRFTTGGR